YGREAIFTGDKLYLRPRYQRWHRRAPETVDEPLALRDSFFSPVAATWDLLAPGAELTDLGATQVSGRSGRKIAVKLAPRPAKPAAETLTQRKWREHRIVEELAGEVVLDDKGAPLVVKLAGTVSFMRDGRRFKMRTSLASELTGIGAPVAISVPADAEVVATPERPREVDDRDFLLQGIAPPLRKNPDGTAATPAPAAPPVAPAVAPPAEATKDKKARDDKNADDEKSDTKSRDADSKADDERSESTPSDKADARKADTTSRDKADAAKSDTTSDDKGAE
ncbi:MAG: hypothetical protein SFX73_39120, partial [Kofleriaceae bacterium]|nr:hypothetical protein [Kofleriaceae bacterium]